MRKIKPTRIMLSTVTGISHGFLLAWVLTLERSDSNQLYAMLSIIGFLLLAHVVSSNILSRSILIITSYQEGLFFFIVTMAAFRIGDYILGITNVSFRTEVFLFSLAAGLALLYVWSMRMVVKD